LSTFFNSGIKNATHIFRIEFHISIPRVLINTEVYLMPDAMQCLEFGINCFHNEFLNDAMMWLEKALEKDSNLPKAHIYLGRCYAIKLIVDEAIKNLEIAHQLDLDQTDSQYWLDLIHQRRYLIRDYRDLFRRTFWLERNDADKHFKLGEAFWENLLYQETIEEMKITLEINPQNFLAHYCIGFAYQELKEFDKSIEAYMKAIGIKPNHFVYNNVGNVYQEIGELNKAIELYKEAITIKPDFADPYNNLGGAYYNIGEFDKAIELYKEAITIKPDYADAYNNLGLVYRDIGESNNAILAYKEAIKIQPDYVYAHYNLGLAYQLQGDLSNAISAYKEAIRIKPDCADAHYNLGLAYLGHRDLSNAISAYKEAIKIQPDYAYAHYNLGLAYQLQGDLSNAISAYKEAIRIKSDYVDAYHNLGIVYYSIGESDKAIEAYNEAITIKPDYAASHNNLGVVYENLGELDKAVEAYNEAIRIRPDFTEAYNNIGNAYKMLGEFDKAIEAYNEAIRTKPGYFIAYNNLGSVYASKYMLNEAVSCWQAALQIDNMNLHAIANLSTYYSQNGLIKESLALLSKASPHPLIHFIRGKICYNQLSDLDTLSSPELREFWLAGAIEAFDKLLESLEDIPSLMQVTIFWTNIELHRNETYAFEQAMERAAKYFPDSHGHLLLASLAGLVMHFIEMLREMCLMDAKSAQSLLEVIIDDWKSSDKNTTNHISQQALDRLSQLSEKHMHLDSTWTYLEEDEYKKLMDSGNKDDEPLPIKNLLDEVDLLVREWIEDVAHQRFLPVVLEPHILEKIYQKRIKVFNKELQECGGMTLNIFRVVYGRALEAIYEECLYTLPEIKGRLSNLRHTLGPIFKTIYDEASSLSVLDRNASEQMEQYIDDIEKSLSSVKQKTEELLQSMPKPVEFHTSEIIDGLPSGPVERLPAMVKKSKDFKGEAIYGIRAIAVTVFSNIICNAQEHLIRHKSELKETGKISTFIFCNHRRFVTVSVQDNGKGIPQEVIDALERGENSVLSAKTGPTHGSGLVIVRDLLHSIGGQLKVRRLPRGGTMVNMRLPRSFGTEYESFQSEPVHAGEIETDDVKLKLPENAMRVLVVDDSPGWLKKCFDFLTEHGAYVVTAEDIQSADTIFRQLRPQMALVDVMLRYGKEGFTLLDSYKSFSDNCKVILMTREIDKNDEDLAFQKGAADYLDKRNEADFFKRLASAMSS
jgi:tetratricopeptide (TPR) repeat protein